MVQERIKTYEVCPKSKCTDFPMYNLGTQHLVDVYRQVGNDHGCMYILVQTGSVEYVMSYCCLCIVVFYNLCNVCDAAVVCFTVNHAFYKDVLEWLWKQVQRVRKDIAGNWVLHHDNAPAHTSLSIRDFMVKKNIPPFHILPIAQI
jgi:hypothetical protein